jgi:hypothetical protein
MDLAEPILGRVIGKHLHEWVESSMTLRGTRLGPSSFDPWFREFWAPVVNLMLVSPTFHDTVSRLVCIAFDVPFPFVQNGIVERLVFVCCSLTTRLTNDPSLVHQVHSKLRSLFYFGNAILYDALQAPPAGWGPLMKAYGNYIIALKNRRWRSSHGVAVSPMNMTKVCEDLHVHLHACYYGQGLPIFLAEDLVQAARGGDKVPDRYFHPVMQDNPGSLLPIGIRK